MWESRAIDASSRCHGFNAHAGVHLMRDVLGLSIPTYEKITDEAQSLVIAPHICGLRWAKGTHETQTGLVSVSWKYDGESLVLKVVKPKEMPCRVILPVEAKALDEDKVSVSVSEY